MELLARPPQESLSDLVENLWCLRDAPAHERERIVPSGTVELVINLVDDEFQIYDQRGRRHRLRGAIVSGCYRTSFDIDTRAHASVMGVHFKPGGAGVLGVSAGDLTDRHANLDDLWGRFAAELRERLIAASPDERFGLLERALLARRGRYAERDIVAAARIALEQGAPVGTIARDLGLTGRRLIALFRADVGLTPKRYARIRRFQRALAMSSSHHSWARIAHASGYCDQAHLCREWTDLAGLAPHAVVRGTALDVKDNHVALVRNIQDPRDCSG